MSRISRSVPRSPSFVRGFTLVELLVAVAILAIGIVGVLRSFLSAVSVLDAVDARLGALQVLDARVGNAELAALQDESAAVETKQETVDLGSRKAVLRSTVEPLGDGERDGAINRISMSVAWQDDNVNKDETIVFFAEVKKQ